ncbi:MAG: hypothetical protein OEV64_13695 [Desulfobulbaceae bacterium]|nr:hypothetical protein [Desulfobulbaceae bacterium]
MNKEDAHSGLLAKPAHPDTMMLICGKCHSKESTSCLTSQHFTLRNIVNLVRKHFGADSDINTFTEIPVSNPLNDRLALADDMLRRKCLRCHPYSSGDDYALTSRGTGCAACHMKFMEGRPESHVIFKTPSDIQCLSCHYSNHVGFDYYGRFEHDFHDSFRTPLVTRDQFDRPYGVEYHDLTPDIHYQKGLGCVDCHDGGQLMASQKSAATCSSCHDPGAKDVTPPPDSVTFINKNPILTIKSTGKKLQIPLLSHPAHRRYGSKVACQVCHAQWSYNDQTTHLLLSQSDDYTAWTFLSVQSDSGIEHFLDRNLFEDKEDEIPPWMNDGITGEKRFGLWYQGYSERRWEEMIVAMDVDGVIKVFRPILDLHLSAINEEEKVYFDNIAGQNNSLLPYTPHTTGPAGIFYENRFRNLLEKK